MGAIGIISLIVALFIFMRRKKESKDESDGSANTKHQRSPPYGDQSGVQDQGMAAHKPLERGELDSRQYYEFPPNARLAELSATPKIGEAPVARSPVELQDTRTAFYR